MSPFDLEQGKISVRLSESVYSQLFADVDDFAFIKNNGEKNPNAFFNQLLPNLIAYRLKKRKSLREFLENNFRHCIKEHCQNKVFSMMDDLFDTVYFDDYQEFYHNHRLHFRLTKSNIINLQGFFNELQEQNYNTTSYLRNLFNEYANMKQDKREGICFAGAYSLLKNAVSERLPVSCSYENKDYLLFPYDLDLNYVDGSIYLLALNGIKTTRIHALRLSHLRNISLKRNDTFSFKESLIEKFEYLVNIFDYTNKPTIYASKLTPNK